MIQTHQTQIIKIGNSNGIRIPKDYLNGFETKDVIIECTNNCLIIKPIKNSMPPRNKWNDILSKMKIEPEDEFNDFDITLNDGLDNL